MKAEEPNISLDVFAAVGILLMGCITIYLMLR